jgi:hypothetical protein
LLDFNKNARERLVYPAVNQRREGYMKFFLLEINGKEEG